MHNNTPNQYNYSPYNSKLSVDDETALYSSQAENYISFYKGGIADPSRNKWRDDNRRRYNSNNYFNAGNNEGNQEAPQQNIPYFYQQASPRAPQFNRNHRPRKYNYPKNHMHGFNKEIADITDYVHSSMLEDPWQNLLERHAKIEDCDLQLHIATDAETIDNVDLEKEDTNVEASTETIEAEQ